MHTQYHTSETEEPPAERIRYIMLPPGSSGESVSLQIHLFIRLESVGDNTCIAFFLDPETGIKTKECYSHSIGRFEEDFTNNPELRRVHRSHIINLDYIGSFNYKTQLITLKTKDKLPLGPSYRDDFYRDIYCF